MKADTKTVLSRATVDLNVVVYCLCTALYHLELYTREMFRDHTYSFVLLVVFMVRVEQTYITSFSFPRLSLLHITKDSWDVTFFQ